MYARVARYEVPPDRCDDAVEGLREAASAIAELDGLEFGYVLLDRESGNTTTITFWRDRAALDASEVRASVLRQNAIKEVGGSVMSVERMEIVTEVGHRAP